MDNQAKEVVCDAADIIEKEGWTQFAFHSAQGYCAMGALGEASARKIKGDLQRQDILFRKARELVLRQIPYGRDITRWNDSDVQTKENVIRTLREVCK